MSYYFGVRETTNIIQWFINLTENFTANWEKIPECIKAIPSYTAEFKSVAGTFCITQTTFIVTVILVSAVLMCKVTCIVIRKRIGQVSEATILRVFNFAKTAYSAGHCDEVIHLVEKHTLDVNKYYLAPSCSLNLFLCVCLSGHKQLITYMLKKGGDVNSRTAEGDSPLYLATFGVLNCASTDISVLHDLIQAGCDVNTKNKRGYTPLHRAATRGNRAVIDFLLLKGADRYCCSESGVYPIDSAINAGHVNLAYKLAIDLENDHMWEIVDPHTPTNIRLGLQSPDRKKMCESIQRLSQYRRLRRDEP